MSACQSAYHNNFDEMTNVPVAYLHIYINLLNLKHHITKLQWPKYMPYSSTVR